MSRLTERPFSCSRVAHVCAAALSAMRSPPAALHRGGLVRWILGFAAGCSVLVGAALLILWALTGFADLGLSGHGLVALTLGIVFTTGLGGVLMALSFYNERRNGREELQHSDTDRESRAD